MKKKILAMILGIAMLFGWVTGLSATDYTSRIYLQTSVGENLSNTGVRVVNSPEVAPASNAIFDALYFSAGTELTIASGADSNETTSTGDFAVLVRRNVEGAIAVAVTGTPMVVSGGTSTIPYTLTMNSSPSNIIDTEIATPVLTFTYNTLATGFVRSYEEFTWKIPVATGATAGTYKATITFAFTTGS